jgi:IS5 family transposase
VIERVGIEKGSRVQAHKGYCSQCNRNYLKANELKYSIMYKAVRNKPLGIYQLRFNKMVGQTRFKVERTFAGIAGGLKKAKPGMWGKQKHISSN